MNYHLLLYRHLLFVFEIIVRRVDEIFQKATCALVRNTDMGDMIVTFFGNSCRGRLVVKLMI